MIKHNNHLYTTIPPETFTCVRLTPNEFLEMQIEDHIDELNFENNFLDLEEVRMFELIKNEKCKV